MTHDRELGYTSIDDLRDLVSHYQEEVDRIGYLLSNDCSSVCYIGEDGKSIKLDSVGLDDLYDGFLDSLNLHIKSPEGTNIPVSIEETDSYLIYGKSNTVDMYNSTLSILGRNKLNLAVLEATIDLNSTRKPACMWCNLPVLMHIRYTGEGEDFLKYVTGVVECGSCGFKWNTPNIPTKSIDVSSPLRSISHIWDKYCGDGHSD